jgi:hypothetical protein
MESDDQYSSLLSLLQMTSILINKIRIVDPVCDQRSMLLIHPIETNGYHLFSKEFDFYSLCSISFMTNLPAKN